MSSTGTNKPEYLVINIGAGIRPGSSVVIVGVVETMQAAMEMVRKLGAGSAGKIVVAEKKTVITRTPIVELKESNETVLFP